LKHRRTLTLAALIFCLPWLAIPGFSQVRGGYETFTSENNADSWGYYDFSDDGYYAPFWDLFLSENPEIYAFVTPDSGISLFADEFSSDASFIGDFAAARISSLSCDAYVEDASSLLFADFYFYSDGVLYFSQEFAAPNYFAADGWEYMEVSLIDDPWFTFDDGDIVQVFLTDEILSTITEIGVDFFATSDAPEDLLVAIDNFALIPELIVPELSIAKNGGDIELGFQREQGQIYDFQQSTHLQSWSALPGYTEITGEGPFTATDPLAPRKQCMMRRTAMPGPLE
jgi:hypothetical protein